MPLNTSSQIARARGKIARWSDRILQRKTTWKERHRYRRDDSQVISIWYTAKDTSIWPIRQASFPLQITYRQELRHRSMLQLRWVLRYNIQPCILSFSNLMCCDYRFDCFLTAAYSVVESNILEVIHVNTKSPCYIGLCSTPDDVREAWSGWR